MNLKYSLKKNHLIRNSNNYVARSYGIRSYNLKGIVNLMLEKRSAVTRVDSLAVLSNFFEVLKTITASGETINTDIFKTSISIKGTFDGANDVFDKDRHEIKVNAIVGKMLKDAATEIQLEKVALSETTTYIQEVKDSISGIVNDKIMSGGVIRISGVMIKIRGDHPDNGVYLVSSDDTKIKVTTLVHNKSSLLIVMLPTLAPGVYHLQITTQHGTGSPALKAPKTSIFSTPLTVV